MPNSRTEPDPELLRRARREAGMTQEEVGERVGLARNSISRYESGTVSPSQVALNMLATVYGKPIEWFFGNAPERPQDAEVDGAIKKRLRLAREQRGWTQQEAGDRAGVSANMIYMYEAGQRRPSTLALKGLASLYNKRVEWFFDEDADEDELDSDLQADMDLIMNEADVALRQVSNQLSPEAIRSIADYIRFVHEREERERRESEG